MPPFIWSIDATLVSLAYVSTSAFVLGWVFHSGQTGVARTGRNLIGISLRLGLMFALILMFSAANGIASWVFLTLAVLPFVIAMTGGNYVAIGCMAIVYIIQQYVLGFPDRDQWVLSAKPPPEPSPDPLNSLIGEHFWITTALRPTGHVYVEEKKVLCESDDGRFIEVGTCVTGCAVRDGHLVVRPLE